MQKPSKFKNINSLNRTIFIFYILCFSVVQGQEGYPLYAEYLTGNPYSAHPSMAGDMLVGTRIKTAFRKQWIEESMSPSLQLFTAEYGVNGRSKLALQVYADNNGYHQQQGVYFTYAHHISFQDVVWNTKRSFPTKNAKLKELYFGISLGTLQNNLDATTFDFSSNDPVLVTALQNTSNFNADVGVSFLTTHFFTHLTVKNLISSPLRVDINSVTAQGFATDFKRVLFSVGFVHYAKVNWSFEPSLLYQTYALTKEQLVDFNFKVYRLFATGRVWGGISFRRDFNSSPPDSVLRGQNLQWVTPLLGIDLQQFTFAYNYSSAAAAEQFSTTGFHQLSLGFSF